MAHSCVYWGVDDVQASVQTAITNGSVEHHARGEISDDMPSTARQNSRGSYPGLIFVPHFKLV